MQEINSTLLRQFDWRGQAITPALCCATPTNRMLYETSDRGFLIDYLRESGCYRSKALANMSLDNRQALNYAMAYAQQEILKSYKVDLKSDFYRHHVPALDANYMLYSSLCYVQSENAQRLDGYYATKQKAVLQKLKPLIIPRDVAKLNTTYFDDEYATTIDELVNAKYKVVTLRQDADGIHLGKGTIYSNSKNNSLYPLYVIRNYKRALLGVLCKQVVCLTCMDAKGQGVKVTTSLNGDVLWNWLRTNQMFRYEMIWGKVEDSYCEANLNLPNLDTPNEFITINLLHIRDIAILSS